MRGYYGEDRGWPVQAVRKILGVEDALRAGVDMLVVRDVCSRREDTVKKEEDDRYCDCETHGPRRHAYIVCKHILSKRDPKLIVYIKPWSLRGAGELCCAKPGEQHVASELAFVCEDSLIDMGLLKPTETRLT